MGSLKSSVNLPVPFSDISVMDHRTIPLSLYSAPLLPIEITEEIIGYLRGDMAALAACSSVCRYWYPHSHVTLYNSIFISSLSASTTLASLAYRSSHVRDDLAHTRELVIIGDTACRPHFPDSILLLFVTVDDQLDTLVFQKCLQPPIAPVLTASLRHFEAVTCLELSDFEVYNMHELIRVVSAPPSLVRLSLIRGRMTHSDSPRTGNSWVHRTAVRVSQRLHELHLSGLQASLLSLIVDLLQSIYCFRRTQLLIVAEGLESVGNAPEGHGRSSSTNPEQVFSVHHQYSMRRLTARQDILLEFVLAG